MSASGDPVHAHGVLPLTHFLSAAGHTEPTSFPPGASSAVEATLRVLYVDDDAAGGTRGLFVQPDELMLLASDKVETQGRVPALTRAAAAAAASIACGSVLAGPTSESDDFGDVGFWLGAAHGAHGRGGAREALRALGLAGRTGQQAERVDVDPETALPASLARSPDTPQVQALAQALAGLADAHAFRVRIASGALQGTGVLYVLLGRRETEWMGLMGLGMWSDA